MFILAGCQIIIPDLVLGYLPLNFPTKENKMKAKILFGGDRNDGKQKSTTDSNTKRKILALLDGTIIQNIEDNHTFLQAIVNKKGKMDKLLGQSNVEDLENLYNQNNNVCNQRDVHKNTPLIFACLGKSLDSVKFLVDTCNQNPSETGLAGINALHAAILGGNVEILRYGKMKYFESNLKFASANFKLQIMGLLTTAVDIHSKRDDTAFAIVYRLNELSIFIFSVYSREEFEFVDKE